MLMPVNAITGLLVLLVFGYLLLVLLRPEWF